MSKTIGQKMIAREYNARYAGTGDQVSPKEGVRFTSCHDRQGTWRRGWFAFPMSGARFLGRNAEEALEGLKEGRE